MYLQKIQYEACQELMQIQASIVLYYPSILPSSAFVSFFISYSFFTYILSHIFTLVLLLRSRKFTDPLLQLVQQLQANDEVLETI